LRFVRKEDGENAEAEGEHSMLLWIFMAFKMN